MAPRLLGTGITSLFSPLLSVITIFCSLVLPVLPDFFSIVFLALALSVLELVLVRRRGGAFMMFLFLFCWKLLTGFLVDDIACQTGYAS